MISLELNEEEETTIHVSKMMKFCDTRHQTQSRHFTFENGRLNYIKNDEQRTKNYTTSQDENIIFLSKGHLC